MIYSVLFEYVKRQKNRKETTLQEKDGHDLQFYSIRAVLMFMAHPL